MPKSLHSLHDILSAVVGDHDHNHDDDDFNSEVLSPTEDAIRRFKNDFARGTRTIEAWEGALSSPYAHLKIGELLRAQADTHDAMTEIFDKLEIISDDVLVGQGEEADWPTIVGSILLAMDTLTSLQTSELRRRLYNYGERLARIQGARLAE